ncbi:MAG: S8 family serine peptidase, partial [Candidatus Omnitrophota bacterium]
PYDRIDPAEYLRVLSSIEGYIDNHPGDKVVVNISLGGSSPVRGEREIIRRLVDKGVIIVAAAGNKPSRGVSYPAAYEGVVAVAASEEGKPASYTSYGEEIDIVADGNEEWTERVTLPDGAGYVTRTRKVTLRGTSFSAPRVTSAIVKMLKLASGREKDAEGKVITNKRVIEILKETAEPIDDDRFERGRLGSGHLFEEAALTRINRSGFAKWLFLKSFFVPLVIFMYASSWLAKRMEREGRLKEGSSSALEYGIFLTGVLALVFVLWNVLDVPFFHVLTGNKLFVLFMISALSALALTPAIRHIMRFGNDTIMKIKAHFMMKRVEKLGRKGNLASLDELIELDGMSFREVLSKFPGASDRIQDAVTKALGICAKQMDSGKSEVKERIGKISSIRSLMEIFNTGDVSLQFLVVDELKKKTGGDALSALERAFEITEELSIRKKIVEAVGSWSDSSIPVLERFISKIEDEAVRDLAEEIRHRKMVQAEDRRKAEDARAVTGATNAYDLLSEAEIHIKKHAWKPARNCVRMALDKDPSCRERAEGLLETIKQERKRVRACDTVGLDSVAAEAEAKTKAEEAVGFEVYMVISKIGSVSDLVSFFSVVSPGSPIRLKIVKELGRRKDPEAIPFLKKALDDENPAIRYEAAMALSGMGGFGKDTHDRTPRAVRKYAWASAVLAVSSIVAAMMVEGSWSTALYVVGAYLGLAAARYLLLGRAMRKRLNEYFGRQFVSPGKIKLFSRDET